MAQKKLIITEKPSVAQEFARILKVSGRGSGYLENDAYVITWCVGHLVEMVYPEEYDEKYKKWKLEDLPFLPAEYRYHVKPEVSKQYEVVHGMLFREDIDTVYWAGDAGKEGQTIEENIRNFGGVRPGMVEKRVWIDSQTEEEILRGLREAKPMSDYANLGKSGIMRTIEDYAMGINFSRALSVKYGNLLNDAAGTASYTAIAVGRVMTCVLGMVVIREREIRNFSETPFFRVIGRFGEGGAEAEWKAVEGSAYYASPLLYKENGFQNRESAEALIAGLEGKPAQVKSIEKGTAKKKAPLLFNLAELQAECAKRFKISPDETLQVAQELYEKKLTTYPRTDARVLSSAVAKEIGKNLSRLKGYSPAAGYVAHIMQEGTYRGIGRSVYTDDSKITDHYAIIPTGQLSELESLPSLQQKVFDLIVRRFLSIFYPPAEYLTVKLTVAVGSELFFAGTKALRKPGYLEVAGRPGKPDASGDGDEEREDKEERENTALLTLADTVQNGTVLPVQGYELREGKTQPPKRYTSGSMVLAMENAGQLIEDEELRAQIKGSGIGTSATRADIIRKLVRVGYLNLNTKTQILSPKMLGEMIYEAVDMTVPELLNPRMTASWEKGLDGITKGSVDMLEYRAKLEDFIRRETLAMAQQDQKKNLLERIRPLTGKESRGEAAIRQIAATCPVCGAPMQTTRFGYGCSAYNGGAGCRFSIGEISGRALSEEEAVQLLTEGRTDVLEGFVSKSKKKFRAILSLEKDEQGELKPKFTFPKDEPEKIEGLSCPVCGGELEKTYYGYTCRTHRQNPEACYFSVGKIAGRELSVEEFTMLLRDGRTDTLRGFKAKSGKKFDACLMLAWEQENDRLSLRFDFENVEAKRVRDAVCPQCGGAMLVSSFGYVCEHRERNGEGSCNFSIGKIAEKDLSEAQLRELLTKGTTGTIRGFKSKRTGKRFDACLVLERAEDGACSVRFDFAHVEAKKLKDVVCPVCGAGVEIRPFGYACEKHERESEEGCPFAIGKVAGMKLKEATVRELLANGRTEKPLDGFIAKTGMMFSAALKLDENKKVVFDFPEKVPPEQTRIVCPNCGKALMRTQWQLVCECGFKLFHTVAKLPLSDEVLSELLGTGKTKEHLTGFTAKSGAMFDAGLIYRDGVISFDFGGETEGREKENGTVENKKPV